VNVTGYQLWQWRSQAQQQAIAASVSADEVDWLLQDLTNLDRLTLRLESFKQRDCVEINVSLAELDQLWQKRLIDRVPVQYLAGVAPWRTFLLNVSPAVLIPRPETEGLVDLVIAATQTYPELAQGHWADLGTGSGAIALGLAAALPRVTIHAVDQSAAALAIAQQNIEMAGFSDQIQVYQGHWFQPLNHLQGKLSGMVSNPPYIPTGLIADLQPEVAQHEPMLALDGGIDGLDAIRELVHTAPLYLQPGGFWLIEMMIGQAEQVAQLLADQGTYEHISIYPDLAGIDRFALAYRRSR
jgi:release factor glutamine methyltransferase